MTLIVARVAGEPTRLDNTPSGNPRYRVPLATPEGARLELRTAPDGALAGRVTNMSYRQAWHAWQLDASGRLLTSARITSGRLPEIPTHS